MTTDQSLESISVGARVLSLPIRAYQYAAAGRPSPCRHDPSCSTYALEALRVHGAMKGSWLAVRRVGRCHPWGSQGYDPVPLREPASERSFTAAIEREQVS